MDVRPILEQMKVPGLRKLARHLEVVGRSRIQFLGGNALFVSRIVPESSSLNWLGGWAVPLPTDLTLTPWRGCIRCFLLSFLFNPFSKEPV